MAQDTANSSSVNRSSRASPPKAITERTTPAAIFTGSRLRKPHPGRNTATA